MHPSSQFAKLNSDHLVPFSLSVWLTGKQISMTEFSNTTPSNADQRRKIASILMIIFVVLIFVPLGVLGSSIEWPDNLSLGADHNLPLVLEQQVSAFWGYFIYLLYSILFFPMGLMMAQTIATDGTKNPNGSLASNASGFAGLSALSRSIGLCRWLFAMPTLARIYVDPNTSEQTKEAVSVAYEMLNGWGGGIGEILGVSLFAAAFVICVSILFIQSSKYPSWMGYLGFLVAIDLFLNLLEASILDYNMGVNLTLAVVLLHFWIFGTVLLFLRCSPCCKKLVNDSDEGEGSTRHDSNV